MAVRAISAPWDDENDSCERAIERGDLGKLKWFLANGVDWAEWMGTWAAANDHLAIIEWAAANGLPVDPDGCRLVGNREMRAWMDMYEHPVKEPEAP